VPIPPLPPIESSTIGNRPLILYAYFETPAARLNIEFFIKHALHDAADFLFVLNGETNASDILPHKDNIRFVHRANECYDMGAFAEVLVKDDMYKRYNRFILMNASIRGPFIPYWSSQCWSDAYLSKLNTKTKLVGMTMNCDAPVPHIQSMLLATDRVGLETLLYPSEDLVKKLKASLPPNNEAEAYALFAPGINSCPQGFRQAIAVEVYTSSLLVAAGYSVDAIMPAYHGFGDALARGEQVDTGKSGPRKERWGGTLWQGNGYESICRETKDPLFPKEYWGLTLHPFDTMFAKTNRGTNIDIVERLTQWTAGREYSSYDVCR